MEEKPRPLLYHWAANIFFIAIALGGGAIFGERFSRETLRILVPAVFLTALLLVPLTRRWESSAIERRRNSNP